MGWKVFASVMVVAVWWMGGAALGAAEVSERAHIFYYDWYGEPRVDGRWVHWGQGGHEPPGDVGANFWPKLEAYSSRDPLVLKQHMAWIKEARVGVLVVTWWGKGSREDGNLKGVMDAAGEAGLKVCVHVEPYEGRTPATVEADVGYVMKTYGGHQAFYRAGMWGGRPVFYVFEALKSGAKEWRPVMERLHAGEGGGPVMLAQTSDLGFVKEGGFDGGYTYDGLAAFKDARFVEGWKGAARAFEKEGKVFVPSVGPGYWDDRAVAGGGAKEPEAAKTRDGGTGATYGKGWEAAIGARVPVVSITSFNEWHEGSQIEPAVGRAGYAEYTGGEKVWLERTAGWVGRMETGK